MFQENIRNKTTKTNNTCFKSPKMETGRTRTWPHYGDNTSPEPILLCFLLFNMWGVLIYLRVGSNMKYGVVHNNVFRKRMSIVDGMIAPLLYPELTGE